MAFHIHFLQNKYPINKYNSMITQKTADTIFVIP